MVQNNKNASTSNKGANQTKTPVLTNNGTGKTGVTNTMLWAFINTHANGNINNIVVVPNKNVVTNPTPNKPATPFGYGGKGNGVRATIQNALLFGTNPTNSNQPFKNVGSALSFASKLGHSAKNPICLLALLNGGYSPSSSTWGVGFITLQVKPTTK